MGRKRKAGAFRHVGFRMPLEHYEIIEALADLKGVDVTAILNLLIVSNLDDMRQMIIDHRASLEAIRAELSLDRLRAELKEGATDAQAD